MTESYVDLTEGGRQLKEYLQKYKQIKERMKQLEKRRCDIMLDFNVSPLSAITNDGLPKGNIPNPTGAASLAIKLDDIDTNIMSQKIKAAAVLNNIIDIISILPECNEKMVLEARFIDCYSWFRIERELHYSRTPATRYCNKGLNILAGNAEVQLILSADKLEKADKK